MTAPTDPFWSQVTALVNFNAGAVDQSLSRHVCALSGTGTIDMVNGLLKIGAAYGDCQLTNLGANEFALSNGFTTEIIYLPPVGTVTTQILGMTNAAAQGPNMTQLGGGGNNGNFRNTARDAASLKFSSITGYEPNVAFGFETSVAMFSDKANNAVYMSMRNTAGANVFGALSQFNGGFPLSASDAGLNLAIGGVPFAQWLANGYVRAIRFTQAERYKVVNGAMNQSIVAPGQYFPVGQGPSIGKRYGNFANHRWKY